jgi:hypothetical protein
VNLEKLSNYRCAVQAAGFKFRPAVRPADEVAKYEVSTITAVPSEQGFLRRLVSQTIPSIEKEGHVDYKMKLRLPESDAANTVRPGARMFLRGEIICDEETCAYTVPTAVRVAPPLPSAKLVATDKDVVVFSFAQMQVEDYVAIEDVCKIFGLTVHYVDLDHFLEPSGTINSSTWAALKGKAKVIWAPGSMDQAHRVPLQELQQHVTMGGALISGGSSTFSIAPSSFKCITLGRKVINAGLSFQLMGIKNELVIEDTKISGANVLGFIVALLGSMSTEQKLQFLLNDQGHGGRKVNSIMLDSYQSVVSAGCCGCGGDSKIAPLTQLPCTIHDLMLSSIRSDLSLDIHCFNSSGNMDPFAAHKVIPAFASANVLHKSASPKAAELAADIHAVLTASGFTDKKCPVKRPDLQLLANQCFTIGSAGNKDPGALSERVRDFDVIQGLSRRKRGGVYGTKDPVDLSWGVHMYVYKGDPKQWF